MKTLRRLLASILTVVLVLNVIITTASAGIEETSRSISLGQLVSTSIAPYENVDYKLKVSSDGILSIELTSEMYGCDICVYDVYGNRVKVYNDEITVSNRSEGQHNGDTIYMARWNTTIGKYVGVINYAVGEGIYYIRFDRDGTSGNGRLSFTATFTSDMHENDSPAATDGSILSTIKSMLVYFTVDIPKGSTLQLGAITPNLSLPFSWTSHNTNVATVTSNGKITAKSNGSAYIAIRFGPNVRIVQVNVV